MCTTVICCCNWSNCNCRRLKYWLLFSFIWMAIYCFSAFLQFHILLVMCFHVYAVLCFTKQATVLCWESVLSANKSLTQPWTDAYLRLTGLKMVLYGNPYQSLHPLNPSRPVLDSPITARWKAELTLDNWLYTEMVFLCW